MKYHVHYAEETKAVCGVQSRPDTFVYDMQGLLNTIVTLIDAVVANTLCRI